MKRVTISSSIILYPIIFLCLFQFLVILLSSTLLPLVPSLLLSIVCSLYLSRHFVGEFAENIDLRLQDLLILLAVSTVVTTIFLLRMNWGIIDFICTTGLLGLVTNVANGEFPLTYLSFPDIVMNYHQGTILLAGIVVAVTSLPVAAALKLTLTTMFFFLNVSIGLWLLQERSRYYFLPSLLFVLAGSADSAFYKLLGSKEYINVRIVEWGASNSWLLAFLLISVLLYLSRKYNHSKKHLLIVFLLILCVSTINAIVFQLLLISFAVLFVCYLAYVWQKKTPLSLPYTNLLLVAFLALITIPKYIPSALSVGGFYSQPEVEPHFLAVPFLLYVENVSLYLLLTSFLPFLAFVMVFCSFSTVSRRYLFVCLLLLVSFTFPVLFQFGNVIEWEMLHKFSLLCIFLSTILISLYLPKIGKYKWLVFIALCIPILMSTHSTTQLFVAKTSWDFGSFNQPEDNIADVVTFLSQHKTTLIPYKNEQGVYCYYNEEYSTIAQWSGNHLKDAYKINFLLDEEFEEEYLEKSSWKDFQTKVNSVKADLNNGDTLIVRKSLLDQESQAVLESSIQAEKIEFENYILYRTRPW